MVEMGNSFAKRVLDMKKNQCDGCNRGMPTRPSTNRGGSTIHVRPEDGVAYMTCEAESYLNDEEVAAQIPVWNDDSPITYPEPTAAQIAETPRRNQERMERDNELDRLKQDANRRRADRAARRQSRDNTVRCAGDALRDLQHEANFPEGEKFSEAPNEMTNEQYVELASTTEGPICPRCKKREPVGEDETVRYEDGTLSVAMTCTQFFQDGGCGYEWDEIYNLVGYGGYAGDPE